MNAPSVSSPGGRESPAPSSPSLETMFPFSPALLCCLPHLSPGSGLHLEAPLALEGPGSQQEVRCLVASVCHPDPGGVGVFFSYL